MQLTLHQLKREFLAHRTGLLIYATALTGYVFCAVSGFAGEFDRSQTRPLIATLFELLEASLIIIPFFLAAAMGIADPPLDEEAHWRALPVRPQHLLLAKLLALSLGVILPLLLARMLALASYGLQAWFPHLFLDLLSDTPAWVVLGLALGALTGDWKKLSMTTISILLGNMLVIFALNSLRMTSFGDLFRTIENGLQYFASNNVFLLGAVTILSLRFFTRWKKPTLISLFAVVVLLTTLLFPSLTRSLVPSEPTRQLANKSQVSVNIEMPSQVYGVTTSDPLRLANLPYSNLTIDGLSSPNYSLPLALRSTFRTRTDDKAPVKTIPSIYFRFPTRRIPILLNESSGDLLERVFSLARAVPKQTIINPPLMNKTGFDLYEIREEQLKIYGNQPLDLDVELTVQLGTFQKLAEIPLEESASVPLGSGRIRIARLQDQLTDKTQILINEQFLRFINEDDERYQYTGMKTMVPTRDPERLRYILVNESRSEACLPVKSESYRVQNPVSYTHLTLPTTPYV